MSMSRTVVTLASLALAIAACESDEESESTATIEGAATTIPSATSTTTGTTFDGNVAVVWRSSVDSNRINTDQPPPQWEVGETTVVLDIVGIVANGPTAGEYGELCQEWVEVTDRDDEQCMLVQFRFDVSADATERGGITVPYVITAEGEQIDLFASRTAWGDTDGNLLIFAVPGAGPGSRIVFNVGGGRSSTDIEQDLEFVIPDAAEWKPVDFFND